MFDVPCWLSAASAALSGLIVGLMIGWSLRSWREKRWLQEMLRGELRKEFRVSREVEG